jgi:hypothetical protein
MKKQFKVAIDVEAYSQADAKAKVGVLMQMAAFVKEFDVNNLAGSVIKSFLISKFEEIGEKKRLESLKEKERKTSKAALAIYPPISKP